MKHEPVKSSNISTIGYEPKLEELHVTFSNGNTYAYSGVDQDTYDALMSAPSKGTFLNDTIKGVYPHKRV